MRESNPTMKRLRWVAERYPPKVLALVMVALAEATGDHGAREAIEDMFVGGIRGLRLPFKRHPSPTTEDVLAYAEQRLVVAPHTRFDRHLPWLARELDRIRRDAPAIVGMGLQEWHELLDRFRSVVDWAEAERVDLGKYLSPDALEAAEEWADERRDVRAVPQGDVVHAWDDGWTVQRLGTREQLAVEGDVMQHCVAEYDVDEDGQTFEPGGDAVAVYSLRDPKGRPHATMEYNVERSLDRYVAQLRGKQNAVPKPEYLRRMVEFRLEHLVEEGLEQVDAPLHADGLHEPFAGAFAHPDGDVILVYEDGTVVYDHELEDLVDDVRREAERAFPRDRPAQRQHVVVSLDQVEPSSVPSEAWNKVLGHSLAWAVMVATEGRARVSDSGDEMVEWLAGAKVDPSVCRPFARRVANVAELYGSLTR